MVKFAGDVVPFTLLKGYMNEPLLLTKDKSGDLHCLSNVCTHRGNIVAYKPCSRASHLRCRYHGRLFDLDGKFVSMPEFKEVEGFPCEDDNLPALPLFEWGSLLFTSLGRKDNANAYLHEMMERMHWLPMHEFVHRPDLDKTFEVDANWALYCEN
jgi:choline monooxygenase